MKSSPSVLLISFGKTEAQTGAIKKIFQNGKISHTHLHEQMHDTNISLFSCGVLTAESVTEQVRYSIATFLSLQKDVLVLIKDYKNIPQDILFTSRHKELQKHLRLEKFDEASLSDVLKRFLKDHGMDILGDQRASIKFTFRITPAIDRYLKLRAEKSHSTKADVLRDEIISAAMYADTGNDASASSDSASS